MSACGQTGRPQGWLCHGCRKQEGQCLQSPQVCKCFMMAGVKGRGKGEPAGTLEESLSSGTIHIRIWGAGYLAPGTSLVVQWLKISSPSAGGPCLIPGQGTRSHMPQLKIPQDAMKTRHSWINKLKFFLSAIPRPHPGCAGLRSLEVRFRNLHFKRNPFHSPPPCPMYTSQS